MNDDALAAVVAAAQALLARSPGALAGAERSTPPAPERWTVAGRLGITDVARARLVARSASRWAQRGRLGE